MIIKTMSYERNQQIESALSVNFIEDLSAQRMETIDGDAMSRFAYDIIGAMKSPPLYTKETYLWDGIDEFGPENIIYDLYVIIDKSEFAEQPLYEYRHYNIEYYDRGIDLSCIKYHLEKTEYHNLYDPELFTS